MADEDARWRGEPPVTVMNIANDSHRLVREQRCRLSSSSSLRSLQPRRAALAIILSLVLDEPCAVLLPREKERAFLRYLLDARPTGLETRHYMRIRKTTSRAAPRRRGRRRSRRKNDGFALSMYYMYIYIYIP